MARPSYIFIFLISSLLVSCQSPAPFSNLKLNFDHLDKISLNVSDIEIISTYKPTFKRPNVDHLYEETLTEIANRYILYKFNTVNTNQRLRVLIKEASLKKNIKRNLKKSEIINIFNNKSYVLYTAVLQVEVQIINERGFIVSRVISDVFYRKSDTENLSINEDLMVYFEICEKIIMLLDEELLSQINKHFKKYLL
ncbi:MAG: hypothetical protein CFH01_00087 [Alphaproteobacteria bacterium MarineAlpha2_Bin1]|nr:MAG: hypothetical protein CFH01_00087 [Alphaproteobacteria bacterium MarineAlpha2_Bin1]|tara:strand:- start:766 stop:1353 length:588 start_codon:yes stop_codon:yes gene_type:complete